MNNYEEYEQWFEENRKDFPLAQKWTKEKFLREQYEDRVSFYLEREWLDDSFTNVIWADVEMDEESPELADDVDLSPEEEVELSPADRRATECHSQVADLLDLCFEKKENSANAAALVYDLLKRLGFVQ